MKTTTIITAKIKPDIFRLIEQGRKRYEVRDESFHQADAIRYVDAETGKVLGVYRLGPEDDFDRTHDPLVQSLSGVDDDTFHRLFPKTVDFGILIKGVDRLHVAPIRSRISLDAIFPEEEA